GDIQIIGGRTASSNPPTLDAPSGRIALVSVASPGEAISNVAEQTSPPDISAFSRLGSIQISDRALLSTKGDGGGTITLRGRSLLMDSSAVLTADTIGAHNGAPTGIDIYVAGDLILKNGVVISAHTLKSAQTLNPGDAGALHIMAGRVQVEAS